MAATLDRIKRRKEFLELARTRRKWAAPGLVLQVAETEKTASPEGGAVCVESMRVGFTCSKKVGNAVARNRAKRRLRALASEVLSEQAKTGHAYVLIGRKETVYRPYALLAQDLKTALKRVKALKDQGQD